MTPVTYSIIVYALIVLVGGVIGYIKAGSVASIAMSALFSVILLFSSFLIHKKIILGVYLSLFLTAFLTVFFGYRFLGSYKLMPAGVMALLSLASFIFILLNRSKI